MFESLALVIQGVVVDIDEFDLDLYERIRNRKCAFTSIVPESVMKQLELDGFQPTVITDSAGIHCIAMG